MRINQMKNSLSDMLSEYAESDFYPFHMPGHKRNNLSGPLSEMNRYDITEIEGFDNLHKPVGILLEAQKRAAALYGSEETYYLINGSTAGILSAVAAVSVRGSRLLIARNCHKAVYHAAFLNRLDLEYLYPSVMEHYDISDGISGIEIEKKLQSIAVKEKLEMEKLSSLIAGIVITSPTYEGIISDVEGIVKTAHRFQIPVIIDQAHGAHFGFHPGFPDHAVRAGADLVIHSVHKTLPAPTQTALLHRNGSLTDGVMLQRYLSMYQTSSPSYLLMAGIDSCMAFVEKEGKKRLSELLTYRKNLLAQTEGLRYISICPSLDELYHNKFNITSQKNKRIWNKGQQEPGKLIITVKNAAMTGKQLSGILREQYHLEMEMAEGSYVTAVLTMMDTAEGFERLKEALCEIDRKLSDIAKKDSPEIKSSEDVKENLLSDIPVKACEAERVISLREAYTSEYKRIPLSESSGRIAADFINLYPPGIPLRVPGEKLDDAFIDILKRYRKMGYTIQGIDEDQTVKVVASF